MSPKPNADEFLDKAIVALRVVAAPADPPDAVLTAVRRAGEGPAPAARSRPGAWLAKAAAAVVVLAGAMAAVWWWDGRGVAYADVKSRILSAKAISCHASITFRGKQPEEANFMVVEGGHLRFRGVHAGENYTAVVDFSIGKGMICVPGKKKAYLISMGGANRSLYGERWLEFLKKSLGDWSEDLGEKEIDGQRARGFRTEASGTTSTIWVDQKTGDLIRIENTNARLSAVLTDFRLDPKVDAADFVVKVPPGYESVEARHDAVEEAFAATTKKLTTGLAEMGIPEDAASELLGPLKDLPARLRRVQESEEGRKVDALCLRPADEALPGLIAMLRTENEDLQVYAETALLETAKRYRKKAVEHLALALEKLQGRYLENVLMVAGLMGFPELAPIVRKRTLDANDLRIGTSGCLTLDNLADAEGLAAVAEKHSMEKVRTCAASLLRGLRYRQLHERASTRPADFQFFAKIEDHEMGPLDLRQIERLAGDGKITGDTMVKRQGASEWSKACEVPDIRDVLAVTKARETLDPPP